MLSFSCYLIFLNVDTGQSDCCNWLNMTAIVRMRVRLLMPSGYTFLPYRLVNLFFIHVLALNRVIVILLYLYRVCPVLPLQCVVILFISIRKIGLKEGFNSLMIHSKHNVTVITYIAFTVYHFMIND